MSLDSTEGPTELAPFNGVPASFQEVIEPSYEYALEHAARRGGVASPEDVAQEAVINAWRYFDSFEGRAPYRYWFNQIVEHCVINQYHRDSKIALCHQSLEQLIALDEGLENFTDTDSLDFDQRIVDDDEFYTELNELPQKKREIVILRDILGFTHEDLRHHYNTTPDTFKMRLFRAREAAAKLFSKLDHDEESETEAPRADTPEEPAAAEELVVKEYKPLQAIHVEGKVWFDPQKGLVDSEGEPLIGARPELKKKAQRLFALFLLEPETWL